MAMEVNSIYGGYANSYATISNKRKTETGKEDIKGKNEVSSESGEVRKTANDELAYLSKKYDGFSFVAADFKPGMKYGSLSTTNIAISPTFLQKMANDPKLEAEYEKEFANMKKFDEQNIASHQAAGRPLVAQGWAIDKDGNISKWGISEGADKRHHVQEMTDYANKIRKQRLEKHKEEKKSAEKKAAEKKQKLEMDEKQKKEKNSRINGDYILEDQQDNTKEKIDDQTSDFHRINELEMNKISVGNSLDLKL